MIDTMKSTSHGTHEAISNVKRGSTARKDSTNVVVPGSSSPQTGASLIRNRLASNLPPNSENKDNFAKDVAG